MNRDCGCVYICHHVDTEGPLMENLEDLFERIELVFGISLPATEENLLKLQKGNISLPNDKKKELKEFLSPHTISFKKNWKEIEEMLYRILSKNFRNKVTDSDGNGWVYNWHILDHVGFLENPRHRDLGYHNIFNFYEDILKRTNSYMDAIHWHFHPISFFRQAHIPATSYENSMYELHQIISRRLIDKFWFPRVNRAGFHSERIDSNLFLEQWIPFDASNQAIQEGPKHQRDLINGRFGDWRGAPSDWSIYNPSIYDWRKRGECNRAIARVLNLKSRHRSINEEEIEKAFYKAEKGENVYLGITNHDWREMSIEIDEFRDMLLRVSNKYPHVKFKFSESIYAFRKVLGYSDTEIEQNKIDLEVNLVDSSIEVKVKNGVPFGPQPYLAIKTVTGQYFHDNFDFHEYKKRYSYVFDSYTIPITYISYIAVASNDKYGNCCIVRLKLKQGVLEKIEKRFLR